MRVEESSSNAAWKGGACGSDTWVQIPAQQLAKTVTLSRSFHLSEPQFPCQYNGDSERSISHSVVSTQ